MKSIHTLVPDIQAWITAKGGLNGDVIAELSSTLGTVLQKQFSPQKERPRLRLSQMGPRCPRALWYSIHHPELAEALPPWAEVKYAFGHIIEALAIALAKAAGHTVEGEQDELEVDGVVGHRDAVIDGCLVDVKSSSSYGFRRFKEKTIHLDDSFGYLDQLDGYLVGSLQDDLVQVKDKGYLLVIDKQLGHMCLYEHYFREASIRKRIRSYKDIVSRGVPPRCECGTEPMGEAGNLKLDVRASYNMFKHCCFPNLRTFLYEKGPVFFTHVAKRPAAHIVEIDKYGQII